MNRAFIDGVETAAYTIPTDVPRPTARSSAGNRLSLRRDVAAEYRV